MGLGLEHELIEKEEILARQLIDQEQIVRGNYRARMGQRFVERQILHDISQCRNICEQLDREQVKRNLYSALPWILFFIDTSR